MTDNGHHPRNLDRILTKKQLRQFVPYTPQHIARLEDKGLFPRRLQLGPNRVGWLESEVITWMENLKAARRPSGDEPLAA